jgi:hypothetical protein
MDTDCNWINTEIEEIKQEQNEIAEGRTRIQYIDFWANLRRQVETDVTSINKHQHTTRLKDTPISLETLTGGMRIHKSTYPAVWITAKLVEAGESYLEVETQVQKTSGADEERNVEKLKIDKTERWAALRLPGGEVMGIPIWASRYILKPIMKALRESQL